MLIDQPTQSYTEANKLINTSLICFIYFIAHVPVTGFEPALS